MFSKFSRNFSVICLNSLTGYLVFWQEEILLPRFSLLRVAVNKCNTFWDFVLGNKPRPSNIEEWVVFFSIGQKLKMRVMRISVSLHLAYGKDVLQGKLLPECQGLTDAPKSGKFSCQSRARHLRNGSFGRWPSLLSSRSALYVAYECQKFRFWKTRNVRTAHNWLYSHMRS